MPQNNSNSYGKFKNVHHFFKSFWEKIFFEYGLLREIALWDSITSTNKLWIGPWQEEKWDTMKVNMIRFLVMATKTPKSTIPLIYMHEKRILGIIDE